MKNVAKLFNTLNLPITWNLPSGLKISQSYLATDTKEIRPFSYSKTKLILNIVRKNKFDYKRQVRALMPNLIHSLDANSLCTLYKIFNIKFDNPQFFSVHDCFATTFDKVFLLKTMLASVYTDFYTNNQYLLKFDKDILNILKDKAGLNMKDRVFTFDNGSSYTLHDIEWVINEKSVHNKTVMKIDAQNIII